VASPQLAALKAQISKLDSFFISRGKDVTAYTDAEHAQATAFMLMASAELEGYVESRCSSVAKAGVDRLRKSQPTATGRALAVWYFTGRSLPQEMPIHEADVLKKLALCDQIQSAYASVVTNSHGISDKDFAKLSFPLGLREATVPASLALSLQTLAEKRNRAAHVHVNRAKSLAQPEEEARFIEQIVGDLEVVDNAFDQLISTFPI